MYDLATRRLFRAPHATRGFLLCRVVSLHPFLTKALRIARPLAQQLSIDRYLHVQRMDLSRAATKRRPALRTPAAVSCAQTEKILQCAIVKTAARRIERDLHRCGALLGGRLRLARVGV